MKLAESYSVIVIPKDRARVKRWLISRERILGTLGLALLFIMFTGAVCVGLTYYRQEYIATFELRNKGKHYEKERGRLLARMEELEEVVTRNETLAGKLETIVGLKTGQGIQVGVGESGRSSPFQLASLDTALTQNRAELFDETQLKTMDLKAIDLAEEAKEVEGRLKEVYRFNPDTAYFWSAVPTIWPVQG
jgi:hypothetical protein